MAFVVADPCVKCKFTDCVEVCPVDCFHEGENFLVINPEECIDCGACVPECPVEAIFLEEDLPAKWAHYTAINAKYSLGEEVEAWPVITESRDALPSAEEYREVEGKADMISPNPGEGD